MDKIKIGGSKPHFGNNQFRLNGGLKKDNDYQCAAWLQFRTGKGEDGRQLPQTNEQRAAIQEAYQTLLDLALKHGNGQLQLSLSIKEKENPAEYGQYSSGPTLSRYSARSTTKLFKT